MHIHSLKQFQIYSKCFSFLDDLDRLYADDYCPTVADILNCRIVTIGINEVQYVYKEMTLR